MKTNHLLIAGFLSALPLHAKVAPQVDPAPPQAKVQIALLLDTSNSMDGLIDQARTQLWKVVNTIHCGTRDAGIAGSWHDGAALAEGKFMIIDQDKAVAHIDAPQDKAISDLSQQLNKTYLGYGKTWAASAEKQTRADEDAAANAKAGADISRAVTKASANYSNIGWDLVDAVREKKIDLAKLPADELPAELRAVAPESRAAVIEKAARSRAAIQSQIMELNKQREAHVAAELKKQAGGPKTLDEALVETTRSQATALGYSFTE